MGNTEVFEETRSELNIMVGQIFEEQSFGKTTLKLSARKLRGGRHCLRTMFNSGIWLVWWRWSNLGCY